MYLDRHRRVWVLALFVFMILSLALAAIWITGKIASKIVINSGKVCCVAPRLHHRLHTRVHGILYSYYDEIDRRWKFEREGKICKL